MSGFLLIEGRRVAPIDQDFCMQLVDLGHEILDQQSERIVSIMLVNYKFSNLKVVIDGIDKSVCNNISLIEIA